MTEQELPDDLALALNDQDLAVDAAARDAAVENAVAEAAAEVAEFRPGVKDLYARPTLDPKARAEFEIGPAHPFEAPDIVLRLVPSRDVPIAGEIWSVLGDVQNHSKGPIWIIDARTILTLAPEMWGQMSNRGSLGALFPTIPTRDSDEVVRIDPGCGYTVVWKVDTFEGARGRLQMLRRIWSSFCNFAFFNPGKFTIAASVHVWTVPPAFDPDGMVLNVGESLTIEHSERIEMEASPWVLTFAASIGGILAHLLQRLVFPPDARGSTIWIGLVTAMLLSGIGTILLSRLATTDFLLVVKVKDFWGAIATGFVIQWLGYSALTKLIEGARITGGGG